MESGKVFLGVLGGIAAGALLGILFAPEKGSKTRKKIMDKGKGYADDLKGRIDGIKQEVNDRYESFIGDGEAKNMVSKKEI